MTMRPWRSLANAICTDVSARGGLSAHLGYTYVERNETSQSPDCGKDYGVPKTFVSINNGRQDKTGQRAQDRTRGVKEVGTGPVEPQGLDDRCAPSR